MCSINGKQDGGVVRTKVMTVIGDIVEVTKKSTNITHVFIKINHNDVASYNLNYNLNVNVGHTGVKFLISKSAII